MLQLLLLISVISVAFSTNPLWPLPSSYSLGNSKFYLDESFTFNQVSKSSPLLARAISRYTALQGKVSASSSSNVISGCDISVNIVSDGDEVSTLLEGVDESYSVAISSTGKCTISSPNIWGSLHALESFTQLLVNENNGQIVCNYVPANISEKPRYGHRGLMIDTARHFMSVDTIKRVIDSLPMSKLNVLHWHTVDAESFPLSTPSAPDMVKGAFSPKAVYTMADISAITQYAGDRGVRMVLELDVPGHAAAWTAGNSRIMADCFVKYSYNINDFALNPTLDETYEVLGAILKDVAVASKASQLHIGGDEVVYGCWANDSSIVSFMNQKGYKNYDQLLGYFVGKADAIVASLGATPVHWEEVFKARVNGGFTPALNTIFQVWTNSDQVAAVTAAKYKVIASPSDYWYLNIADNTWKTMYAYDPTTGLTTSQKDYIIGGEAALWSEQINENNMEGMLYPRLCAVAERLWSPVTVVDQTDANARLIIQDCRMMQRGVKAAPVQPGYCSVQYV